MAPSILAVVCGSTLQITMGVFLYGHDLEDPVNRLGLTGFGVASVGALLGLANRKVRELAMGVNALAVLICSPAMLIGVLEGFSPPADAPLGKWMYPVLLASIAAAIANCLGLSRIHHHRLLSKVSRGDQRVSPDEAA